MAGRSKIMKTPIYLDHAATTPVDPRVVAKMVPYLSEHFGNPASTNHEFGRVARRAVEEARSEVARLINASEREIVWTSGATESDNLAIKGAVAARGRSGHLVTVRTEHKAVLDSMAEMKRAGYDVTYLAPEPSGLVPLDRFAAALRPETLLASVMLVNNEIGVVQDIAAMGAVCRERGVLLHVDAAQATGKVPIDVAQCAVDLMSLTAHKTYGPKGIGALFVRRGVPVQAQMHGGGHEGGLRSGTLATHQIVGMGECFRIAREEMSGEIERMRTLRDRLWSGLRGLPGVRLNGDLQHRIANNLNVSIDTPGCEGLLDTLADIAVSSSSACSSGASASHVLEAIGASSGSAIRMSVGRFNTEEEIDYAVAYLRQKIEDCRIRSRAAA
jgi:cysteine desulfurase